MIRSGLSVGRNTTESSLNDQLRRFKPLALEDKEDKVILDLAPKGPSFYNPARETLQQKCIKVLVANFAERPIQEAIPPEQMAEITSQLPVMLASTLGTTANM